MPGVHEPPLHRGDAIRGDAALAGEFLNGVLNGDDRSRGAHHRVPAVGAVHVLDHLELLASRVFGIHHVARPDAAIGEVFRRHRHAAHVQAFHEPGLELAAQDQFGAAAADVGHEARVVVVLVGVRHAEIDEPRLLAPADDLDAMPKRLLGSLDEVLAVPRLAQRIGADDADVLGRQVTDALREALQAVKRSRRSAGGKRAGSAEPLRQAHHFLVPINHLQPTVLVVGDDEVETVGA